MEKELLVTADATMAVESNRPILIVGADGTIGSNLACALERSGRVVLRSTRRRPGIGEHTVLIDLEDDASAIRLPERPVGTAFLCAGVTDIERCRLDPATTRRINVDNTLLLARRLADAGVFTVFLSSNTVFDGHTAFAKADAPTHPSTEYGRQKADVERQLLSLGDRFAVVRLSKVLAPDAPLLTGWIRALRAGATIHPFVDGVIAPVSLACAVGLLQRVESRRAYGMTQLSASQDMSYVAVARYIAAKLGASDALIQPIANADAGVRVFPKYTTLDSSRVAALGLSVPPPTAALDQLNLGLGTTDPGEIQADATGK